MRRYTNISVKKDDISYMSTRGWQPAGSCRRLPRSWSAMMCSECGQTCVMPVWNDKLNWGRRQCIGTSNKSRNTLKYRPHFADDPVFGIVPVGRPLGSIYIVRHVVSTLRMRYLSSTAKRSSSTTSRTSSLQRPQGGM